MSRRILLWGAGGHGRVLADLVRACGHEVGGYVDARAELRGQVVEPGGARVVTGESECRAAIRAGGPLPGGSDAVVVAIGDNRVRLDVALALRGRVDVPTLVHPSAVVSPSAELGEGTVVLARAVINAAAVVGAAVIVNTGAVVEHDCHVRDGAHLSPGAILAGAARVGTRSWVGAGAVMIPGTSIGADVTVGAGAVVIRDVLNATTVVGVPARPVQTEEH